MPSQRKTLLCRYHYDALDQLIGHRLPDKPELQRFYCKSRLATEIQGAIQHSIFQQGDQLLAQQQRQDDALDTTLLATDQQRSVLHTLKANDQRHPIAYAPYGHRPAESGLTSLLGFNGERPDPVTGYYLLGNGYRAFNPVLMRFNSPDSWSPFGKGGLNPYGYCLGDPTNFNDPNGRMPKGIMSLMRLGIKKEIIPTSGPMQQIRMIDDAAFTFLDNYKGKIRLNIKAHGEPGALDQTSTLVLKNRQLSPEQLHTELKANYSIENFYNIRILACHSADGGANSFAAKFSQLTGKPVKGYKGIVLANNDPADILEQFNYSRQHFPNDPYSDLDAFFANQIHHIKKGKGIHFYPEKIMDIRNG